MTYEVLPTTIPEPCDTSTIVLQKYLRLYKAINTSLLLHLKPFPASRAKTISQVYIEWSLVPLDGVGELR